MGCHKWWVSHVICCNEPRTDRACSEPFNDDGTWRTDVFYNTLGTSYVGLALTAARAADPAAKLYINDYNIEGTGELCLTHLCYASSQCRIFPQPAGAKSTAMVNLVTSLKAAGTPIDGIGIQGHLIVGEVPTTLQANIEQFVALGVEVAITELDIRMTLPATDALLAQQKADYEYVITACNNVAGCIGVTIWDYTDKVRILPLNGLHDQITDAARNSTPGFHRLSRVKELLAHGTRYAFQSPPLYKGGPDSISPEPCEETSLRWHSPWILRLSQRPSMQLGYVFVLSCSVECTLACFMFRLEILREDWLNRRDQMRAPVEPDRD